MSMPTKIGAYEIIRKVGKPGLSEVYLAREPSTGRQVVIKRLREQDLDNNEFLRRFRQEAKILGDLENAPIVPMHEYNDRDEQPYIVMRHMAGGTLGERINGEPLPLEQIIQIVDRIAKALAFAIRKKVIHRDLKPNNIMFDENGDAFLCDFGLSKQIDASMPITSTEGPMGTPLYMSPEQISNTKDVDARSDIYSLGVILYEMLTGVHPYANDLDLSNGLLVMNAIIHNDVPQLTGDELKKLELPPECNHILKKAMAKNPIERYEKASDMARDVVRLQNSAVNVSYKQSPEPASFNKLAIYWCARVLDNLSCDLQEVERSR